MAQKPAFVEIVSYQEINPNSDIFHDLAKISNKLRILCPHEIGNKLNNYITYIVIKDHHGVGSFSKIECSKNNFDTCKENNKELKKYVLFDPISGADEFVSEQPQTKTLLSVAKGNPPKILSSSHPIEPHSFLSARNAANLISDLLDALRKDIGINSQEERTFEHYYFITLLKPREQ